MSDSTTAPVLRQNVKWGERYVSSGLNKKLAGIIAPGVYHGFELKPGGAMTVLVTHSDNYPTSVAVVERNGYNLNITMDDPGYVTIPAVGDWYIVIEAFYIETQPGYQRIVARETVEDHHVVLGKVSITEEGQTVSADSIDTSDRAVSNLVSRNEYNQLINYVDHLGMIQRGAWTLEEAVEAGSLLTLPGEAAYVPGCGSVMLSYDGVNCYLDQQFTEAPADEDGLARAVYLTFNAPAGSEFEVVIHGLSAGFVYDGSDIEGVPSSITDRVEELEDTLDALEDTVSAVATNAVYVSGTEIASE